MALRKQNYLKLIAIAAVSGFLHLGVGALAWAAGSATDLDAYVGLDDDSSTPAAAAPASQQMSSQPQRPSNESYKKHLVAPTAASSAQTGETPQIHAAMSVIAQSNHEVQQTSSGYCAICNNDAVTGLISMIRKPTTRRMNAACSKLVNSNGEVGPIGQSLESIMAEPKYKAAFTRNNALGQFCPKFNQLTPEQKIEAWTWFWTGLAQEESSCNPTKEHATTYVGSDGKYHTLNPREGYGLWALERDRNVRRWRGAACSNIGTPAGQARCAIDIMLDTQLKRGLTAGVNQSSYWGPVRRGTTQIVPHMRRLKLCYDGR